MNDREEMHSPQEQVFHTLIQVSHMHRRAVENEAEKLKLHHSQHMMLVYLVKSDEPPAQKDIANALEISPAAVAVTLSKLESEGYIKREASDGDGRRNRVFITDKGRDVLRQSRIRFSAVDALALSGFDGEELAALTGYLKRIKENLRGFVPEDRPFMPPPGRRRPDKD